MHNGYDGVDTGFVVQVTSRRIERWVDYDHVYYKTREGAENAIRKAFEDGLSTFRFRILFRRDEVLAEIGKKED